MHNSPLKTHGKKTRLVPAILELAGIVEYDTWIEPFLGSGIVAANTNCKNRYLNDANFDIINFYNQLAYDINIKDLETFLYEQKDLFANRGEEHYREIRSKFNSNEDLPLYFMLLTQTCFNGVLRYNQKGEFNTPYNKKDDTLSLQKVKSLIKSAHNMKKLLNESYTHLFNLDFVDFFNLIRAIGVKGSSKSIVYCDPPYIGTSGYISLNWTKDEEIKLRDTLIESGHYFIVSTWASKYGVENELISDVWGSFYKDYVKVLHKVAGDGAKRNVVEEVLITNIKHKN